MNRGIIVDVKSLNKYFGKRAALSDLNFCIRRGEIFGLLGPNGAGKSTFISILTTLCKPSSGDISVNGLSVNSEAGRIKRFIGFVPQEIALYSSLSGMDNLLFWAGIYGLKGRLKDERINEALNISRLSDRAHSKVEEYSGGMKRRLNIAVALLHHPEILVMDEPTVGVDIQSRRYILDAIASLKEEGKTVVFTSHYIDELEALCDRIAILDNGKIRAVGPVKEVKETFNAGKLEEVMLQLSQ